MSDEAKREIADECMLQYNSVATQLTQRVLLSRPEDPIAFIAGGQDDTNGTYVCLCLACAPPLSDAMLCYRVRARIH